MDSISIDVERFAYDIFRINWIKCQVPRRHIPFNQSTENRYPRNFIRSISKYVLFYQVLIRSDIRGVIEEMYLVNVDDDSSMFEFLNAFMKLDKDFFIFNIMQNVACSLAICLELSLYKYPTHRRLLEHMSERWRTYFQQFLQLDFFLKGGFEGLFKHAESMHASDYTLDKYIYESNKVYDISGANIWTTPHVPTFLEANDINVDERIRHSTVSLLNYCSINGTSRILRILFRSERLPVVGKWIRWTRKRVTRIGATLLRRRFRRDSGLLDCISETNSSEYSTEERQRNPEVGNRIISAMIENYIRSVQEYNRG
ncbi:hypothetical protein HNY73_019140 [Argiope bruennichi]|uniref:Uncharacterized protein n=1 Tax=Argiope bruennichi TaxID=94029 RepID=A0A8T0EIQ3_ARGBR|nr:hypothetical protein HNY73_019140 [Argiope bruennichi]